MNQISIIIILCLTMSNIVGLVFLLLSKQKASKGETKYDQLMIENEQLVDEMERVNHELHLVRLSAGESDRLKSAFLSNMSHELRTPLHAILGFAGIIANPSIQEEEKMAFANIINHNVDSLLEIINDIFDISQFEAGDTELNLEEVNVNDMVNTLQTGLNIEKSHVGKNDIVVKTNKPNKDKQFSILTDGYKIRRALCHLTSNALKYSKDGSIEIGYFYSEEESITFYVKDQGIGFAVEHLEQMLKRFRQLDESNTREYGGLGLGLTLAQKFSVILQGRLWAESEMGKGSTFFISVPNFRP